MSKLSEWYKHKSGLRDFVERWKRPVFGLSAGALGGAGLGALGSLGSAASLGQGISTGAVVGGLAGASAGYQRTKEQQAKYAAREEREKQEASQRAGREKLDEIIAPYLPPEGTEDPTTYRPPGETPLPPEIVEPELGVAPDVTGGPVSPPPYIPAVQPDSTVPSPVTDQDPTAIPSVPEEMGNLDISGAAGRDVSTILDETERARQMQMDLWNQQQQMKAASRSELAELLNQQMERQYSEQVPGYLEDLNTRGLLRSSALGDRLAQERSRMGAGVNEQLALQAIQDQYGGIEGLGGIQESYLQGRQGALGRRFSLEDYARQMEASKALGQAVTPVTPYTGGGKSGTAQTGMAGAGLGMSLMQGKG